MLTKFCVSFGIIGDAREESQEEGKFNYVERQEESALGDQRRAINWKISTLTHCMTSDEHKPRHSSADLARERKAKVVESGVRLRGSGDWGLGKSSLMRVRRYPLDRVQSIWHDFKRLKCENTCQNAEY
jgi:hypothetical protein